MSDQPNMIKFFNRNPSYENYTKIRKFVDPKIKLKTHKYRIQYIMFLYIIDIYYPRYKELYNNSFYKRLIACFCNTNYLGNIDCDLIYKHVMGDPSLLCVKDLDILWLLFYATGDNIYSDQVKLCAITKKYNIVNSAMSKTAAMWSYNNNISQNIIKGPEIEKAENFSITDPLFFYPDNQLTVDRFTYLYGDQ